jgi:uncharacterized protein
MTVAINEKILTGFTHPALSDHPSLRLTRLTNDKLLLLDPDNVFWAVLSNDNTFEKELEEKVLPLYQKQKAALDEEMRAFRFDINLSAVYINATDRCNGRCQYCYIPEYMRTGGDNMSRDDLFENLKRIISYFKRQPQNKGRKPVVVFHGSEPLMVKREIKSAIEHFNREVIFGIQTNATLMNEQDARFFMDYRVSVGLSLDSLTQNDNTFMRPMVGQRDAFSAVMDALSWFKNYKGLSVITTITQHNVHELADIVRFLHKRGVTASLLNPIRCTLPETVHLRPNQDELYTHFKEAVDVALDLTLKSGQKIVVSSFSNTILAIVAPVARRLMCDITPCGGARRFFYILPDNSTTPCGEFIPITSSRGAGIIDNSFESVLDSQAFKDVRTRAVESIKECAQCLYRNICGAPCPGEIHETNGTMFAPSPYCEFYTKLIDYAFELIAQGHTQNLVRNEISSSMKTVYSL